MSKKIKAVTYEVVEGGIKLYDADDNHVQGEGVYLSGNLYLSSNQLTNVDGLRGCTIGWNLYLDSNQLTNVDGLRGCVVGRSLYLYGNQLTNVDGLKDCIIGGNLYLHNNQLTNVDGLEGCIVGRDLHLDNNQLTNVDGLRGCTIGWNLSLYGNQLTKPYRHTPVTSQQLWDAFYSKGFVYADGILTRYVNHKGSLYKTEHLRTGKTVWVIKDGDTFAHGETPKKARDDLTFKRMSRDISQFKGMALDTTKTPDEWALVYRAITGACEEGIEMFIEFKGKLKNSYTLAEILEETKGAYRYDRFKEVVT